MPMCLRFPLSLICLLVLASACTSDSVECTTIALAGLEVTVPGAGNTDGGVTTVTITDGDYVEELSCAPQGDSLVCSGATERPGTYEVNVVEDGEVVMTEHVTVGKDECHVIPEKLTLE